MEGYHLAMADFPVQKWCEPYELSEALCKGTIFPCLNMEVFFAENTLCSVLKKNNASVRDRLNMVSFALNDLTLYMDTHPDCKNGLTLMKKLLKTRLDLLAEYAKTGKPVTQLSIVTGIPDSDHYQWGEGPVPWEGGCADVVL